MKAQKQLVVYKLFRHRPRESLVVLLFTVTKSTTVHYYLQQLIIPSSFFSSSFFLIKVPQFTMENNMHTIMDPSI